MTRAEEIMKRITKERVLGKTKPEWTVTVVQMIKIGPRKVAEPVESNIAIVERRFTVRAATTHQARKAVEDSGVRGKIVKIERVT